MDLDKKIEDMLDEAVELLQQSGEEPTLENLIKASIYLKRLYELKRNTIDAN
jgi:hypothetical protein